MRLSQSFGDSADLYYRQGICPVQPHGVTTAASVLNSYFELNSRGQSVQMTFDLRFLHGKTPAPNR